MLRLRIVRPGGKKRIDISETTGKITICKGLTDAILYVRGLVTVTITDDSNSVLTNDELEIIYL